MHHVCKIKVCGHTFACSLTLQNAARVQKKVSVRALLCVITLACAEQKIAVQSNWQLGFGRDLEPDRGLASKDGEVWAVEERTFMRGKLNYISDVKKTQKPQKQQPEIIYRFTSSM